MRSHIPTLLGGVGRPALSLSFAAMAKGSDLSSRGVTFTRSGLATQYDSTGKLTWAPNNLALFSSDLTNAGWNKVNSLTVTAGQTASDGSSTAFLLTSGATNGSRVSQLSAPTVLAGSNTIKSVWAKAGNVNYISVADPTGPGAAILVDLTTGTVANTFGSPTSSVTSVGNGWYRIAFASNSGSGTAPNLIVGPCNTTAFDGGIYPLAPIGSTVYVWQPQLEAVTYQTTPRPYVATTSGAYYGPRFDYDPATLAAKGLLIEEARTNSAIQSQDWTNASWAKTNLTTSISSVVAPDGVSFFSKLQANATSASVLANLVAFSYTSGSAYTQSFYAKAGSGIQYIQVPINGSALTTNAYVNFDIINGVVTASSGATGTITSVGNGVFRLTVTATANATVSAPYSYIWFVPTGAAAYTAAGTWGGTEYVYVWGAQWELGSFATSYIPTTSASVTRAAETASMTGTALTLLQATQGTVVASLNGSRVPAAVSNIVVLGGSTTRFIYINGAGQAQTYNGTTALTYGAVTPANASKIAMAWDATGRSIVANNGTVAQDANSIGSVTAVTIGSLTTGAENFNGWISSLSVYATRKSNTDLQALTR